MFHMILFYILISTDEDLQSISQEICKEIEKKICGGSLKKTIDCYSSILLKKY